MSILDILRGAPTNVISSALQFKQIKAAGMIVRMRLDELQGLKSIRVLFMHASAESLS